MALSVQERARIALRYGQALFRAIQQLSSNDQQKVMKDAKALEEFATNHPDFKSFLKGSRHSAPQVLQDLLEKIADVMGLHPHIHQFLSLLIRKRRLGLLLDILIKFEDLVSQSQGIQRVTIESAQPLSVESRASLQKIIKKLDPNQGAIDYQVDEEVKPDLLGGVVLRLGGYRIDASLRGKLNQLNQFLKV